MSTRAKTKSGATTRARHDGAAPVADAARWAAVERRDPAADGVFYYAVKTTGVYCFPSCPSRRPRPENVSYFETGAAAEAAGYRPCRRCRPGEASPAARSAALVTRACRIIESSDETPALPELAAAVGLSPFHFHRIFKEATGLTPKAYAAARRDERVRAQLDSRRSVTEAIYAAGFNSSASFYASSAQAAGMSPAARRAKGAGETVRFAIGRCALGALLVAATDRGVCSIALGDDPGALLREFEERFSGARLIGDDPEFARVVAAVVAFVDRPGSELDLPLDIRGTAFQRRVWEALRGIPAGETASYSDVAERLGSPGAVRAVARACATNELAVAIPCHRVVRKDGGLSGYRWGVDRKRTLIAREAAAAAKPRRAGRRSAF